MNCLPLQGYNNEHRITLCLPKRDHISALFKKTRGIIWPVKIRILLYSMTLFKILHIDKQAKAFHPR